MRRPSRRRSPGPARIAVLGLAPLCFFLAHLLYGMDQALAAQWFVAVTALIAAALAMSAPRGAFSELRLAWPVGLFLMVLAIAALSLIGVGPHEPHRLAALPALPRAGTIDVSATLLEISKLGGLACAFVLGLVGGANRRSAKATLGWVLWLGVAYAAIGLILFFSGTQAMAGQRLSVGFLSFNSAALVFGMLCVLAIGQGLTSLRKQRRVDAAAALGQICLFGLCLYLTASRMGVVATGVAAVALVVWDALIRRSLRAAAVPLASALALALIAVLLSGNSLLRQRMAALDADVTPRQEIVTSHWAAFLQAPLGGYGLGSFTEVNNIIMAPENYGFLEPVRAMHNVYLQWLEEGGVLAATPMFALIACLLIAAMRRGSRLSRNASLLRGLVAASLVVLLMGITDFGLQVPSIAAFWAFLLGLACALGRSSRRRRSRAA